MMKKLIYGLLLIGFLWPLQLIAQEKDGVMSFTFQEALDYATVNAFQSKSADYDIEAAEKVWEYLAIGMPQVDGSSQFTDQIDIPSIVIDGQEFKMGTKYNWNVGGDVKQLLFDGTYFLGVRASKVYVNLSRKNKVKTEIAVREAVAEAYYLALIAKKNLVTFQENLMVNQKTLTETQSYFQNGFREQTDVDQVRLMVNTQKNLVLEAERQLVITEAVLKYAMGINIDQSILLEDSIETLLSPVEVLNTNAKDFSVYSHIDYSIMETQEEAQRLILRNEKYQYFPKLNAFYNYTYSRTGPELDNTLKVISSMWGLSLSVPIFSSGQRLSKVKQEKIKYLKVQNEKQQLEQQLRQSLMVAKSNFENAKSVYQNDKEGEAIAFRIYDKTRIKFTNGLSSSTELSQNEGQYIQSQIKFITSTVSLLKAHIQYQKAINQF